jgi:2-aminoadipate transaminase
MYSFADRLNGISGSAIRQIFMLLEDPEIISFAGGNPSPQSFPSEELSGMAMEIIKKQGSTVLQYGGTVGLPSLIDSVAARVAKTGIQAKNDEIIIISGSSQGIDLMAKAFINPGDCVLVESPTFLGALQTFLVYQADLKSVETDACGLIPEDLEKKIKLHKPKFLYTIPTFQNPTGITMIEERRKKVLEICEKAGVLILEDDPYRDLRYAGRALPPIKSCDTTGNVVYLFSFSKIISPGIRVGAAVADAKIIQKFNVCKQGVDVHTSNLSQAMADAYCRSGLLEPHIAHINAMYRQQMDRMLLLLDSFLPGVKHTVPEGGLFIWAELPEGKDALNVFKKAVEKKVAFVPGTHFYCEGGHENTLRLNFSMASIPQIEAGMERLAAVIRENM